MRDAVGCQSAAEETASRLKFDEALCHETIERLAQGCAAGAEGARQCGLVDTFSGLEFKSRSHGAKPPIKRADGIFEIKCGVVHLTAIRYGFPLLPHLLHG